MKKKIVCLLILFLMYLPQTILAANSWDHVASKIDDYLDQSYEAYHKGDKEKSKELLNEAYFGPFESERMEQAIRVNISSKRAAEIEFQFNSIRKKIIAGEDQKIIRQEMNQLEEMIRADAKTLQGDQQSPAGLWFYSFLIIVREGVEAILVIAAIAAYLVKSGNADKVKDVYQSAGVAVLASLVAAYLMKVIFNLSGAAQEVMEGAILLIATGILFSMSYWMFSKADNKKWKNYIQGKVHDSLGNGKRFALWSAVFLAVFREGAETVLFYQALLAESEGGTSLVWLGILAGSAVLIVLFYIIRFSSMRIPLKPFFLTSSALLYLLAFIFAGEGIKELQASGYISNSEISGFGTVGVLGIYPSWEGIAAQSVLVLLLVVAVMYEKIRRKTPSQNHMVS